MDPAVFFFWDTLSTIVMAMSPGFGSSVPRLMGMSGAPILYAVCSSTWILSFSIVFFVFCFFAYCVFCILCFLHIVFFFAFCVFFLYNVLHSFCIMFCIKVL